MQIMTSWMEQGIERGIEQGERSLILRQLTRRLGELPEATRSRLEHLSLTQLEALGEALLDFRAIADLDTWLQGNRYRESRHQANACDAGRWADWENEVCCRSGKLSGCACPESGTDNLEIPIDHR